MSLREKLVCKTRAIALARSRQYGEKFGTADALATSDGLWLPVVWLREDQGWMILPLAERGVFGTTQTIKDRQRYVDHAKLNQS